MVKTSNLMHIGRLCFLADVNRIRRSGHEVAELADPGCGAELADAGSARTIVVRQAWRPVRPPRSVPFGRVLY